MDTKAQGQNGWHSGELPSSMRARMSWRPLAAPAVAALWSGALSRHATFVERTARLSVWHEQLRHRLQPRSGWSFPALEFHMGEGLPAGRTLTTPAASGGESALTRRAAPPHVQPAAAQQPRVEATVSRPAMRLPVLRSSSPSPDPMPRSEPGLALSGRQLSVAAKSVPEVGQFLASALPVVSLQHPLWRPLLTTPAPVLEPRLVTSVRSTPRQEVRGGFPVRQPLLPAPERARVEPATLPLTQGVVMEEPSALLPVQPAGAPKALGAIAQLIEQTVLPMALPGLGLRLVRPEQQASTQHHPPTPAEDRKATTPISTPPVPVRASPPQLDLNAIADKVFNMLMRRQQLERDRRGLY